MRTSRRRSSVRSRPRPSQKKNPFAAKKSLGQNFLHDPNVIRKIIEACRISSAETVLEIGAGQGILTEQLAQRAGKVLAVETDRRLVDTLQKRFADTNVTVLHADILKLDLQHLPNGLKVVGNLPYYISSAIIARLLENKQHFRDLFFTVQWELGERLCAVPGNKTIGAFTHFVQYHCTPKILFKIPAGCFQPVPKVDSCFLEMNVLAQPPVEVADVKLLFELIRIAFQQRRKTLVNALSDHTPKETLWAVLKNLGLNPQARCETLSLKDFSRLANQLALKIPETNT